MSIIAHPRDYKDPLHPEIQKLLDAISDFEFTTPDGLVFKMSDINEKVPIYLDTKKNRDEKQKYTWGCLNSLIDDLQKQLSQQPSGNSGGNGGHARDKDNEKAVRKHKSIFDYYRSLLAKLKENRDDYLKEHPNPNSDDIVSIPSDAEFCGYYTRKGRSHDPEIVLLMDTLGNNRENAKSVAITLVHEMFHAFYDYDLNEKDTDIPYVEEPLTEYAVLKFMEALKKNNREYERLYKEAKNDISGKKTSLGLEHYGFGSYLWEYEKEWRETLEGINWIEAFHDAKYMISENTIGYEEYVLPFLIGIYPFQSQYYQMRLLRMVLLGGDQIVHNPLTSQPRPEMDDLPFGVKKNSCGDDACWGKTKETNTIILDGDYSSVDTRYDLFGRPFGYFYQVILWDHFKCDSFAFVKEIIKEHAFARVKLSSHNYNFVQDKGGAIFNAAKTALFYCPETAKECIVPDSVVKIVAGAFDNCTALQHVEIPSSVKTIPEGVFKDCKMLDEVIIHNQRLLWVPNNATDYVVPNGVKEIDSAAFRHCRGLQHLTIPAGVTVAADSIFDDCVSLDSEIVLGQKLLWVPNNATDYTIPSGVKEISGSAFKYCKGLRNEVIFNQKLFCAPKHVKEYEIPDGVTTIDDAAFAHCSCTRLTIPASIVTLQSSAFGIGSQIRELVFKGNNLPAANKPFFFAFNKSCVIWVPKGCKQTFKRRFQSHPVKEY